MHTLVLGAGFSGTHIAQHAQRQGPVCVTRRSAASLDALSAEGMDVVQLSAPDLLSDQSLIEKAISKELKQQLSKTTHLISCVGPGRSAPLDDPILRLLESENVHLPQLQWVAYLSTIGVYGHHDGNWIDEDTPCTSEQSRSIMRREAELGWQRKAASWQVPLSILRLSGIYGPGRNAVEDAIAGRARMLIKPNQVFNRIHVEDLAAATLLCAERRFDGVINITDDLPAAPQDIIMYAHALVNKPAPQAMDFATADITDMARSFYSENKRVSNALSKQALGMRYRYPTYKEGLDALYQARS
ncbi:MAG: NAD-dependent epimerase/dehydratase family protein [Granulosicoccus sp.]